MALTIEDAISVKLVEQKSTFFKPQVTYSVLSIAPQYSGWSDYITRTFDGCMGDGRSFADLCSAKRQLELEMTYKKIHELTDDEILALMKIRHYMSLFAQIGFTEPQRHLYGGPY